ncbi:WD40 repeat domain-containing protein [Actinoplanes sp. CA-015351]|uniref:WD40 repeat domain-containing protein n=1 Tax=Actinoplanes sp. CA-015351 TaxID=3239897 RepID=UPI003D975E4F
MIDSERLDRALSGTPRVIGLVGPPGPDRTALARDAVQRFPGAGWITLAGWPPEPDWMHWPDTPEAADLTLQIVRTLRSWDGDLPVREPVAAERAAAELAAASNGRLLVVDGVRTAEQVAMFDAFSLRGRLLLITEKASLLPRGAVVVWGPPSSAFAFPQIAADPLDPLDPFDPLDPLDLDPGWICRRLAEEGAPALAVDLAIAWAAEPNPALVTLARTLRAEEINFAGVRTPSTLAALITGRLGLPGPVPPPCLVNRWPPPGRFGSALVRRIMIDRSLVALAVTKGSMWTADGGAEIAQWDPLAGRRLRRLTLEGVRITGLLPAPDDSWIAISLRSGLGRVDSVSEVDSAFGVSLVDPVTREVRGLIPGDVVAAAPDGSWLAVGDQRGEVRVHDTATFEQLQLIAAHWARITALAVAPDGSWLASAGEDGTVRITDVRTGRPRRALAVPKVTRLAVDPRGKWLAAAGPYGVHLIDPARGSNRRIHPGGGTVHDLVTGGSWLAAAYEGLGVLVFDGPDLRHTLPVEVAHHTRLASAPDGSWLAAGYPMRIWDTATGVRRPGFPAGTWSSQAVAPDGTWLAAHVGSDVLILDLTTAAAAGPSPVDPSPVDPSPVDPRHADPRHADPVQQLAAGTSWLATRAPGGTVSFWDPANGRSLPTDPEAGDVDFASTPPVVLAENIRADHGDREIAATALSPDGRWLAVLSHHPVRGLAPQLRIYDHRSATLAATMPAIDGPAGCRWSPDGTGVFLWGDGGLHGFTWVTP